MGSNRLLVKGVNQLYLTISELNLFNNATYSLVIKEETTQIEKSITVLDTSLYAIRYNQFAITLVDDPTQEDLGNSIVYLNTGKHTYTFISHNPLSPFNSMVCEVGIIKVLRDSTPIETSYTDNIPEQEYISYTGNISQNI